MSSFQCRCVYFQSIFNLSKNSIEKEVNKREYLQYRVGHSIQPQHRTFLNTKREASSGAVPVDRLTDRQKRRL